MDEIEAFIITNGRSTFPYALKSLETQTCSIKITEIRDMKWVDALNFSLKLCKSKHYIRCDDDHLLHPRAVDFLWHKIRNEDSMATYSCKLWEDWSHRPGGGIKIYNTAIVRELGGFKANHFGKVDKEFAATVRASKFRRHGGGNILVGVHACAPFREQLRYEKLWSALATHPYQKSSRQGMMNYKKSIEKQFRMRLKFVEQWNRKEKNEFHKFLKRAK